MPARVNLETVLYTRQGCGLCDEAKEILQEHGLTVQSVDIDQEATLRNQYDLLVPVVWIAGKERFRGKVNPVLLRRLLENQP